ncbi:MAG: DUF169 domain-containing protein [Deltaproteobacteria bacterium]|nr:DUF169 domain-containing protein [Deltaproteobacteria bacterium]
MSTRINKGELQNFAQALCLQEMPLAVFSTDEKPSSGFTPGQGWKFQCVVSCIRLARKKRTASYFSRGQNFCPGGMLYTNVIDEIPEFIAPYVSTGIPGVLDGERYCRTPEIVQRFLEAVKLPPDPLTYRVFKPIEKLTEGETPELVIFYARPEILSGLYTLVQYYTGGLNSVITPWGAGCTALYTWVKKYMLQGKEIAVLGGFDVTARPHMELEELTLSMPYNMFLEILKCYKESFIFTKSWPLVKRRIGKSQSLFETEQDSNK